MRPNNVYIPYISNTINDVFETMHKKSTRGRERVRGSLTIKNQSVLEEGSNKKNRERSMTIVSRLQFGKNGEKLKTGMNFYQAAISSCNGKGAIRLIFFGTRVLEKKAEHRLLFSNGQSTIFQHGVNLSSFFTALILMPWT